jgi:hypothetical protein
VTSSFSHSLLNPALVGMVVFGCVFGGAFLATIFRKVLPEHHLSSETKDTVKLAMGLVATMTALVLGLLVASAKGAYDAQKSSVITSAAKLVVLDLAMARYGPEAAPARGALRQAAEDMTARLWPDQHRAEADLDPNTLAGGKIFDAVEGLAPQNDLQRDLKSELRSGTLEMGQMRWPLFAESGSAISIPLLLVVVCWLAVLFFSFGLFAPPNHTALVALFIAAVAVSGAIFLILELDQPFDGLIRISGRPMDMALSHMGK